MEIVGIFDFGGLFAGFEVGVLVYLAECCKFRKTYGIPPPPMQIAQQNSPNSRNLLKNYGKIRSYRRSLYPKYSKTRPYYSNRKKFSHPKGKFLSNFLKHFLSALKLARSRAKSPCRCPQTAKSLLVCERLGKKRRRCKCPPFM